MAMETASGRVIPPCPPMADSVHPVAGTAAARTSKCSSRTQSMRWIGTCLTLAAWMAPVGAYEADPRFIFISSPTKRNIQYAALPNMAQQALHSEDRPTPAASVLIDGTAANCTGPLCLETADKGLQQPEGLAVWHARNKAVLYVADLTAQSIFAYQLTHSTAFGTVLAGPQQTVAKGLGSVAGLALDGSGNLYFTTLDGNVGRLPADSLNAAPEILYSADGQSVVSNPYGLAADSFNIYWTNQANGQTNGALIKAFERDATTLAKKYPDMPKIMAKNLAKAAGVCVAESNVFFTGQAQLLYGVKTSGGAVTEVSRGFQSPRGCAYDGENTLYVADNQAHAVYSLPANFPVLRAVNRVHKAIIADAPGSVAVFTCAPPYAAVSTDKGFFSNSWTGSSLCGVTSVSLLLLLCW